MSLGNRILAEIRGDRAIWAIITLLCMVSIIAVYSATGSLAFTSKEGNTTFYLVTHVARLAFGLLLVYLCHLMHYRKYHKIAPVLMIVSVPMLFLTLAFGQTINSAARWFEVFGVSFQTSEFAKIALIIYIARELTRKQEYITDFKQAFMPIIVPVLLVCGLIAPANLSTAAVLFATCMVLMFIGRVDMKYIMLLALLAIVVFAMLIAVGKLFPDLVRVETWVSRVSDYVGNPDGGYQVQIAKMAIAKGGLFGVGPGNSIVRNFLPYAYADFIYAIICEEWGLIGGTAVLILFIWLFFRSVALVTKSPKAFGTFLSIGLSLSLVIQALANMAVSVHLVPVTVLTLPLISMGGTSILFTCISLGMILSVSKYVDSLEEM
jgi:cell division protein FtsW